jgi:fucose permease
MDVKDVTALDVTRPRACSLNAARAAPHRQAAEGRWAFLVFFVYTGLEVAAGQWTYSLLTEARSVDAGTARR